MIIDIRVPEAGESITQVELARWLVTDGQYVNKDQEIAEIDSDKATLTINASEAGIISISLEEGSSTEPGKIIGTIDTSARQPDHEEPVNPPAGEKKDQSPEMDTEAPPVIGSKDNKGRPAEASPEQQGTQNHHITISPQAKKILDELQVDLDLNASLPDSRRITKKDILTAIATKVQQAAGQDGRDHTGLPSLMQDSSWGGGRDEKRQKMSTLRRKIAERLVAVKNQTAMLTTFNEVDMSAIMRIRNDFQDAFTKKYGFKLGFMSFFAKALAESIPWFPQVNGYIDGDQMVIPDYADIGIAVSTPKGLMVPVIRNAERLSIPELEKQIQQMAARARDNKISLEELKGGTISITNGGIFGSMLSTPIINPPQSAILGMHNIIDRPVAINNEVVIRPMMYLALSYDHRIIDGKESVGFLVKVKEMIENPLRLLSGGHDPESVLLGL
jgi:2-oxoglutarate dehydrogenase E2 component (dihydrolipoamide succinyltransferase)